MKELDATGDDPQQALREARRWCGEAGTPRERYWAWLNLSHAQGTLEHATEAKESVALAAAELKSWPQADAQDRVWLLVADLRARAMDPEPSARLEQLVLFRQANPLPEEAPVACELSGLILWYQQMSDHDEDGWREAQRILGCARALGRPNLLAQALSSMATLRWRRGETSFDALYDEALALAEPAGLRYRRSVILWERGNRLLAEGRYRPAQDALSRAIALSRQLGDDAGIVDTAVLLGRAYLEDGQAEAARAVTEEGWHALARLPDESHGLELAAVILRVAASLKQPDVGLWIGRVAALDVSNPSEESAHEVHQALAEGYAAQGRTDLAYLQMRRSKADLAAQQQAARDRRLIHLQRRYDAELRAAQAERMTLQTRARQAETDASRRVLLTALGASLLLLAGAAGWLVREARHRRIASEMALRDELTGAPNRRAILSQAEQALRLAGQRDEPLCLAIVDLDHFKAVNDHFGHAGGDAVLRALVHAARHALRSGDRFGRYGGEEWLLVLPGAGAAEAVAVHARLRARFQALAIEGLPPDHRCSFSMGAAMLGEDGNDLTALIRAADDRLYRAKEEGRDRCVALAAHHRSPDAATAASLSDP